jgi:glutathione S-transferase
VIRLYRAPWSTNVERVALALAHKGLEAESVWIDYADRGPVEAVSGQGLVPVIQADGEGVFDSPVILRWLEERHPDPPLFPRDAARRAEMDVFVDWFNRVWKPWPNGIEAELGRSQPDERVIAACSASMSAALDRFELMLAGRDYLMADELTAADCIAFPFLKFALRRDPDDDELFHRILDEHQSVEGRPRVSGWIERMDACPRV